MLKVVTLNCNGIRSAAKKGFFDWLEKQQADIICLQETRANVDQLTDPIFQPQAYHAHFVSAERRGYSGVALYTKRAPDQVITELGWELADKEGRYLRADFGNLSVISLYLPSGTSGDERQAIKYQFLEAFDQHLQMLLDSGRQVIIAGDFNIAHQQIDLKNWRNNQKSSGFLPEERAWLDHVFDKLGFVDTFRRLHPDKEQYTWWSNRANAWANNVGWRIDYQIATPNLADAINTASVYRAEKFSDHAPLTVEYQGLDLIAA